MLLWLFFMTVNRSWLVWFFFSFSFFLRFVSDTGTRRFVIGLRCQGLRSQGLGLWQIGEGSRKVAFYSSCRGSCCFIVIAKEYHFPKADVE